MGYNEVTTETLTTSTNIYTIPNMSHSPYGTFLLTSTTSHPDELSTPSNSPFYPSSFQHSILPTSIDRFPPTIQSSSQPAEISHGNLTSSQIYKPKNIPL